MTDFALFEAALVIRNDPRLAPFRDWLTGQDKELTEFLVKANDDRSMHVTQGELRQLHKLSGLLERAPEVLEKKRQ